MPSMLEIYQGNSYEYDELVTHEDYQGNLKKVLQSLFNFSGKSVIELGTGTGRVTQMYIREAANARCFDRSSHMLDRCEKNLREFRDKISFGVLDNNAVGMLEGAVDCVIEGWSFGHTIAEEPEKIPEKTRMLVDGCRKLLNPGGKLFIIESLGTNFKSPAPPNESLGAFFSSMEQHHGLTRTVVETDYKFISLDEAVRIMGFFFGEPMCAAVKKQGSPVIKEFTGIWHS